MNMADEDIARENIAQTLARTLPIARVVEGAQVDGYAPVLQIAVPAGHGLQQVDTEPFMRHPRRMRGTASLGHVDSFLDEVRRQTRVGCTKVWCAFDALKASLSFRAVFNDHEAADGSAGWRDHAAVFTPAASVEWGVWNGQNRRPMGQGAFAEFIEENAKDFHAGDGTPTSLQMLEMATQFEANADKRFKSKLRLQSGGVQMEFVNTDDEQTVERMRVFERFSVAVPVFSAMPKPGEAVAAYPMVARLKYTVAQGAVSFRYELIRPDLVYQTAASALIEQVRTGLPPGVPLLMGACV